MTKFFKQYKSTIIAGIIVAVVSYYIVAFINKIPLSTINVKYLFLDEIMGPTAIISISGIIIITLILVIAILWNHIRILNVPIKSFKTSTDSDTDNKSDEDNSLEKETKDVDFFELESVQNSILFNISEIGTDLEIRHLMESLKLSKTEVGFHIDKLKEHELIRTGGYSDSGAYYYVTPKGREYLMTYREDSKSS